MTATSDSLPSTAPSAPVVPSERSAPDDPARSRSGPAEVPVALVVAARKGDPAAFARIIEHWNPHLRPFVHHVLSGEGSTDRALSAAYVRAYRALPRYEAERKPGLWLHRIAFLAATDELRRVRRDPARRRALADAGRAEWTYDRPGVGAGPDHVGRAAGRTPALDRTRNHAPDQEPDDYEVLHIDFGPDHRPPPVEAVVPAWPDAARAVEPEHVAGAPVTPDPAGADDHPDPTPPEPEPEPEPDPEEEVDTDRESAIIEARNLMALGEPPAGDHPFPPGWRKLAPDQRALAVLVDLEDYRIDDAAAALDAEAGPAGDRLSAARRVLARNRTNAVGMEPTDPHEQELLVAAARATLAEVVIPPADPDFWSMLGRRLLAERESPAAPSIDPMARLAKAHPAEPGFTPNKHLRPLPGDLGYDPVQGLADQAEWVRPPRRWDRIGLVAAIVVAAAALVAAAIWVGTSGRIPDGSSAAAELVDPVATAMTAGPYREVSATVIEEDPSGRRTERPVRLVLAGDGSWAVSDTATIDQTTYDAATGLVRRVAVVGTGDAASVFTTDVEGLAAGAPDPAPHVPAPLAELSAVPALFRVADSARVPRTTVDDRQVWSLTHTLPTGDRGEDELWRVLVDTETSLPVEIQRSQDGRVVRRVVVDDWSTTTEVDADTFAQPAPPDTEVTATTHGFITTELAAVPMLGRGEAVTPSWLPAGFELTVVAVRADPPAGAATTADGANPADDDVASLGFQRGSERITVTTRAIGPDRTAWQAPFAQPLTGKRERTLGDGRFNGTRAFAGVDEFGNAHLWGISSDTVFTVSGDLTLDDAFRVATSLR